MSAKTAVKKSGPRRLGDTGSLGMAEWTPRHLRNSAKGSGGGGGKAARIVKKPPVGGWTGSQGK